MVPSVSNLYFVIVWSSWLTLTCSFDSEIIISFIFFDDGLTEKIPGAFFVSVAPCGHTAVVLCSAYNVSPENIIKALFISTFASIGTIFFAIQYLQVA